MCAHVMFYYGLTVKFTQIIVGFRLNPSGENFCIVRILCCYVVVIACLFPLWDDALPLLPQTRYWYSLSYRLSRLSLSPNSSHLWPHHELWPWVTDRSIDQWTIGYLIANTGALGEVQKTVFPDIWTIIIAADRGFWGLEVYMCRTERKHTDCNHSSHHEFNKALTT